MPLRKPFPGQWHAAVYWTGFVRTSVSGEIRVHLLAESGPIRSSKHSWTRTANQCVRTKGYAVCQISGSMTAQLRHLSEYRGARDSSSAGQLLAGGQPAQRDVDAVGAVRRK